MCRSWGSHQYLLFTNPAYNLFDKCHKVSIKSCLFLAESSLVAAQPARVCKRFVNLLTGRSAWFGHGECRWKNCSSWDTLPWVFCEHVTLSMFCMGRLEVVEVFQRFGIQRKGPGWQAASVLPWRASIWRGIACYLQCWPFLTGLRRALHLCFSCVAWESLTSE